MKKGKYMVEMTSDDVYFANRQVDRLFEKLLAMKGKLRVVLPSIDAEKVEKETKELEQQRLIKELTPDRTKKVEKQEDDSVKPQKEEPEQAVKEVKEVAKPAELEKPKPLPAKIEKVVELVDETEEQEEPEILAEEEDEAAETVEEVIEEELEEIVELVDEIEEQEEPEILAEEEEEAAETVEEVIEEELEETVELVDEIEEQEETEIIDDEEKEEAAEEVIQEGIQGNIFENILAEKTQEIEEYYEEEEKTVKEPPKTKKTFTFKNIVTEKIKNLNPDKSAPRQKAGFKTREIEEPEEQRVKPHDIVFEEDEEIAKILEEKIKKSIPQQENKTISVDEQEITAVEIIEPDLTYDEEESDETDLTTQEFESLGELIAVKKPQSKLDYLLLTAYYLQTSESLFKYSLKQLNSKAMPFLGSLIDHAIIHNAVAQDFIEVVPDYNGTSEVTEYRLTLLGENYLINEL